MTYIFLLVILITLYSLLAIVRTRLNFKAEAHKTRRAILHYGGDFNPAEFRMGYKPGRTLLGQDRNKMTPIILIYLIALPFWGYFLGRSAENDPMSDALLGFYIVFWPITLLIVAAMLVWEFVLPSIGRFFK